MASQATTGPSSAEAASPSTGTTTTSECALNLKSEETMQICLRQPCPYQESCNEIHVSKGLIILTFWIRATVGITASQDTAAAV